MSTPLNEKECIIAMYDSYAKTVMRNQCRNAIKSKRRRQKREIAGTEKIQYLFELQSHTDVYPSERLVVCGEKYTCVITSEKLYQAMTLLPEKQKAVIILDFWYGWTDQQIALYLKVTVRTIYNWRQKAFRSIRNYYERKT